MSGVLKGEVNVRYGPGTNYPRIDIGQAGDRFQITGYHTQVPWVEVAIDKSPTGRGWIALDLLDISGDIYSLPPTATLNLNLPALEPTPSVISSSNLLTGESRSLSPLFTAMGNRIWDYVLQSGFRSGKQ